MMTKNFQQLVNDFIAGATMGNSGSNLRIVGDKLIHYETVIAERYNDEFLLNITRYSIQTGRLQKILKEAIPNDVIKYVKSVPKGYRGTLFQGQ